MIPARLKRILGVGVAGTATVLAMAGPLAPAASAETSLALPKVCQGVPGAYPGATISVGGVSEHVPSISNIYVCLYNYAVTTTGLPLPKTYSGCGAVCFKIDSPGASADFSPYIRITFDADGVSRGITYTPPPVHAGYTEPICVSVGTPAPDCVYGLVNLEL